MAVSEYSEYQEPKELSTGARIGIAAGVLALVAGLGYAGWHSMSPKPVPAVAAFGSYAAPDQSFVCESPTGWQMTSAASGAIQSGALFQSQAARIDITSDLQGSLMGDVARSANASMSNLEGMVSGLQVKQKPAIETVHDMGKKELEGKYKEYQEGPGKTYDSKMGEARFSEYTADGGMLVGKLHGFRVTMLGGERRIHVFTHCQETDWPKLKPCFSRVINSIAPGSS